MDITGYAINADAGMLDGNMETLRRELDYYHKIGFNHIELSPHGVGVIFNGRLVPERMGELYGILSMFPFRYTVHSPNTMNLMNLHELEMERNLFLASIEFTRSVKADNLIYHCGRYISEEDFLNPHHINPTPSEKNHMWETEKRLLQEMATAAKHNGVSICLENAPPYLNRSPYCYAERLDQLKKMVVEVDRENVGICLDAGHAYLASRFYSFDYLAAVASVAPYVKHIHLHDNYGRASTFYEKKQLEMTAVGRGDMHMPIGWGEVPVTGTLSILKHYQGVITLVMQPRYRPYYKETLGKVHEMTGMKILDKAMSF
jgi:sugar phosphate isomerase/epimerase